MQHNDRKVVWLSSTAQDRLRRAAEKMGISQGELLARLIYRNCGPKEAAE